MKHWAHEDIAAYQDFVSMNFADQISDQMERKGISQASMAKALGVTEGRVSQILGGNPNLTLKTMIRMVQAIGLDMCVVAYEQDKSGETKIPLYGQTFKACWDVLGQPTSWPEDQSMEISAIPFLTIPDLNSSYVIAHWDVMGPGTPGTQLVTCVRNCVPGASAANMTAVEGRTWSLQ